MYTNVHGCTGAGIMLATHAFAATTTTDQALIYGLGGVAAVTSHHVLDRFGEQSYGPGLRAFAAWEAPAFAAFAGIAYLSGHLWPVLAAGWVLGNAMDIVDKKAGLTLIDPKRWPWGQVFACHRPGFVRVALSAGQTKAASIAATATLGLAVAAATGAI